MNIRQLKESDFDNGFDNGILYVLSQLTEIGNTNRERFEFSLRAINANPNHFVFVAEEGDKVVGTVTLLVRPTLIHSCASIGHLEEMVVDGPFRNKGVASALMRKLIETARKMKCYKIVLDCSETNITFYQKFGFKLKENQMRLDL